MSALSGHGGHRSRVAIPILLLSEGDDSTLGPQLGPLVYLIHSTLCEESACSSFYSCVRYRVRPSAQAPHW
jgi:hypothetical protein